MAITSGKWVFITGISDGVGKYLATKLADGGYKILGISRSKPDYLEQYKEKIFWFPFDLANTVDCNSLVQKLQIYTHEIDLIILNAAEAYYAKLWELNEEKILRLLNINLLSPIYILKYFLPFLPLGGQVIFVSSSAVNFPAPYMALYAAAKAAQESIALSLNVEAVSKGLIFKIIRPGEIATGLALKAGVQGGIPTGRFVLSPEKVADGIVAAIRSSKTIINLGFVSKLMNCLNKFGPLLLLKLSLFRHKQQ